MADDIRLDVEVAARSTGTAAVLAQMNALAKASTSVNRAQKVQATTAKASATATSAQATAMASMASSATTAAEGQKQLNDQTLRYANFDMASTLLTVAAAIGAVGVASAVAFAQQEKAFTSVERILAGDGISPKRVQELRDELVELSETIPVAFTELSEIASFGAALDIASDDLDEFSSVVARFVALTGADAETAGKSLARIFQYTEAASPSLRQGEEFEQLGSAIVRLGNVSIATENDVLKFAQSISPLGIRAGVSAEQILAMATATASFASINVEGAGSAFSRVFANLDRVVGQGGDSLTSFANISGTTAEEFAKSWREDAGGTFNQVLEGLNKDIPNLTSNLDELGIRNERDRRVVTALATNYERYTGYLNESNKAVEEGTFLTDSYAFAADDLASKWQVFLNTLVNTASTVGGIAAPALSGLLDTVTNILQAFRDFSETPVGGFLVSLASQVLALVAGWAALRGLLALSTAGFLALKTATSFLGSAGLGQGVRFLGEQMGFLSTKTLTARGAFGALRTAGRNMVGFFGGPWGLALTVATVGITMWATHVAQEAARARDEFLDALDDTASSAQDIMSELAATQDQDFWSSTAFDGSLFTDMESAMTGLEAVSGRLGEAMSFIDDQGFFTPNAGIQELAENFGLTWNQALSLDKALDQAGEAMDSLTGEDAVSGLASFGDAINATNEDLFAFASTSAPTALESILDLGREAEITGSDLEIFSQVMADSDVASRAAAEGVDTATAAAALLQDEIDALNQELDDMLSAFRDISTPILDVQAAQDALSEAFNRAQDAATKLKDSGEDLGKVMSSQSQEALNFRGSLRDLHDQAIDTAADVLISSGDIDKAMGAYRRGRQNIIDLLVQMGLGPAAAKEWADKSLPSMQEIEDQLGEIKTKADIVNNAEINPTANLNDQVSGRLASIAAQLRNLDGKTVVTTTFNDVVTRYRQEGFNVGGHFEVGPQMWTGGFTGRGAKYEPAGTVHKGEYVIPKHMVNQSTGLPYADALGKLVKGTGGNGYANGGFVRPTASSMPSAIALTPGTIQQIAAAVQPFLVVDGQVLTESVNQQRSRSTTTGAY